MILLSTTGRLEQMHESMRWFGNCILFLVARHKQFILFPVQDPHSHTKKRLKFHWIIVECFPVQDIILKFLTVKNKHDAAVKYHIFLYRIWTCVGKSGLVGCYWTSLLCRQ
jgi:hypothetical protein